MRPLVPPSRAPPLRSYFIRFFLSTQDYTNAHSLYTQAAQMSALSIMFMRCVMSERVCVRKSELDKKGHCRLSWEVGITWETRHPLPAAGVRGGSLKWSGGAFGSTGIGTLLH